jgi:hypothetical protein
MPIGCEQCPLYYPGNRETEFKLGKTSYTIHKTYPESEEHIMGFIFPGSLDLENPACAVAEHFKLPEWPYASPEEVRSYMIRVSNCQQPQRREGIHLTVTASGPLRKGEPNPPQESAEY